MQLKYVLCSAIAVASASHSGSCLANPAEAHVALVQRHASLQPECSEKGKEYRFNNGGCCAGLEECREPRPTNNVHYCAENDAKHGTSCWSTIQICRSFCKANANGIGELPSSDEENKCSAEGDDASGAGCCAGLTECREDRPTSDIHYCAQGDPKHGNSCWSTIQNCRNSCQPRDDTEVKSIAQLTDETSSEQNKACSTEGTDANGAGCCPGLTESREDRPTSDIHYCAQADPNHGKSCWSTVQICRDSGFKLETRSEGYTGFKVELTDAQKKLYFSEEIE